MTASVDLSRLDPKEVIKPRRWDEYEQGLRWIWAELVRLNTSQFILKRIGPFHNVLMFGPDDGLFIPHVITALYDLCLLGVTKLATDKGKNRHTLPNFKNRVLREFMKDAYRQSFQQQLALVRFDKRTQELLDSARMIRNNFVAHLNAEALLRPSQHPRIDPDQDLPVMCEALNSLFETLCFHHTYRLLPMAYDLPDRKPDVERILDLIAAESSFVNLPETRPRVFQRRRKHMAEDGRLEIMNEYRRRLGLAEA